MFDFIRKTDFDRRQCILQRHLESEIYKVKVDILETKSELFAYKMASEIATIDFNMLINKYEKEIANLRQEISNLKRHVLG